MSVPVQSIESFRAKAVKRIVQKDINKEPPSEKDRLLKELWQSILSKGEGMMQIVMNTRFRVKPPIGSSKAQVK